LANELPGEDRGALLALLGSAERTLYLAERIRSERRSVSREPKIVKTQAWGRFPCANPVVA
jgi:phosphate:Na+ symporter